MYRIERLNSYNKVHIKELNLKAKNFNKYNEDLYEYLNDHPWYKRVMLGDKIYLLKFQDNYEGFIWYVKEVDGSFTIKSLYICPEYATRNLLRSVSQKVFTGLDGHLFYSCTYNDDINNILNSLGFKINNSFVELALDLNTVEYFHIPDHNIQDFAENFHEETRCFIQNEVFHSENRVPLRVDDIIYEERQNFYIKKGGILIRANNKYVGYGQIILTNNEPYIVNVGILNEFRHDGLGNILMKALINRCKHLKYDKVYIRCYKDNEVALKLYKQLGFKEETSMYNWVLN